QYTGVQGNTEDQRVSVKSTATQRFQRAAQTLASVLCLRCAKAAPQLPQPQRPIPLAVKQQSQFAMPVSEECSALMADLTCVTLFPDQINNLEPDIWGNTSTAQEGSLQHLHDLATCAKQLDYGRACETKRVALTQRLMDGGINSFSALWEAARESICDIHATSADEQTLATYATVRSPLSSAEPGLTYTPWAPRYIHLAREVVMETLRQITPGDLPKDLAAEPFETNHGELSIHPPGSDQCKLEMQCWGQPVRGMDEPPIPLTKMIIRFNKALLRESPDAPDFEDKVTDMVQPACFSDWAMRMSGFLKMAQKIEHTCSSRLGECQNQLEHLFADAMKQAPGTDAALQAMARIYWWSAHAMLDQRGSAAKTELLFRALCHSKGLNVPPWKAGVSADLLCMKMDESRWLREFKDHLAALAEKA
ncbi:MAG TPA: hypothetical protein VFV39_05885, partial [Limnobacter sp.]|nr:hypothetical protein [Limnobacter sp.]